MGKTNKNIIEIQNVDKVFWVKSQPIHVLKSVSISIAKGDFTILFGPSGCGKSTMLHILLGLEEPTKGKVQFMDHNFYSMDEDQRSDIRKRNVGMIYQQSNWIKALNVVENVAFPLALIGVSKAESIQKATEMLKLVGMSDWALYAPTELSSGQQQKIALARALTTDPQIIVADEPTGNLDYQSGVDLMELFKTLNQQGKTVIMVTHDLGFLPYAKTIINVFDGKIVRVIDTKLQGIDLIEEAVRNKVINPAKLDKKRLMEAPISLSATNPKELNKFKMHKVPVHILNTIRMIITNVLKSIGFIFILVLYFLTRLPFLNLAQSLVHRLIKGNGLNISRDYLIDLSFKNFWTRKIRTFITIGGMAIGIGAVVFLVSIGYGLEKLVISRVAKFDETKQIEATPAVASNVKVTEAILSNFNQIEGVKDVLPVVGVVGKINYQNSNSDVAVYGVLPEYLKQSALIPTVGSILSSSSSLKEDTVNISEIKPTEESIQSSSEVDFTEAVNTEKTKLALISPKGDREAVVNESFIKAFGMIDNNAIGKKFTLTFTVTSDLTKDQYKIESNPIEYKITGVLPDTQAPIIYTHIEDIKQLTTDYYSQVKLILHDQSQVSMVRKKVEVLGFKTTSVLDTINQIEQLFKTVRIIFGIVGFIALAVASLGMFNTLTISLLERTHEVGLMKAIGMKSFEVQNLFLTESMIMGITGGLGGLLGGFLAGKGLSLFVSILATSKDFGFIDISLVPTSFTLFIIFLSLLVGVVTGIYPAYRSSNISALNALRYE